MTSIRKIRKQSKSMARWIHNDVARAVRKFLSDQRARLYKNPLQS